MRWYVKFKALKNLFLIVPKILTLKKDLPIICEIWNIILVCPIALIVCIPNVINVLLNNVRRKPDIFLSDRKFWKCHKEISNRWKPGAFMAALFAFHPVPVRLLNRKVMQVAQHVSAAAQSTHPISGWKS
jgi:hypothetical protein